MTRRLLLLVRHGVTDWNREGRFQGHADPPLADEGYLEAQLLARRLDGDTLLRPARVVSSTLARARQTADTMGETVGIEVEPDARLIEIGQGEWEGRTHAELAVTDADRYAAWRRDAGVRQPPGGEPIEAATQRIGEFMAEVVNRDGAWPLCVVSHGGTLRILARVLLDAPASTPWSLDVDNVSLSVCSMTGDGWRLDRWNDTLHLLGTATPHINEFEGRPASL
ncbi:MAG: histidine phosphatase family protein [Chloroflexota bacterium]|nr:histidine phosphatase family protein [Chloroflexota bacterium]